MRILNLAAGEKWTGTAAVVFDQTRAMVDAGMEAQFGFVGGSPLAERLSGFGWARPLFGLPPRWPSVYRGDLRRIRDAIAREGFDVIHAHGSHDHWVSVLAAHGLNRPVIRTVHHLRHVPSGPAARWLFARTRMVAFANRDIAGAFGSEGPIHSPVVDTDLFHPGPKPPETLRQFGLPEKIFLVGTIGKMAAGRGHEEALQALAQLPPTVAAAHVGHGEILEGLQRRAESFGMADRNFWLGYQEERLPGIYRCWDACLFTASGSEQGQRAILEAMASGVPVVALDLPGVRDLMTDGQEGYIVARQEDLSERLARLAGSSDLRAEMSRRARQRSLAFTASGFAEKARAFYQSI